MCGTYVWVASDHPSMTTEFVPERSSRSCRRCTQLIGMPPPDSLEAVGSALEWMATLPWIPAEMQADYRRQLATFIRLRPALEADPALAARYISERTGLAA